MAVTTQSRGPVRHRLGGIAFAACLAGLAVLPLAARAAGDLTTGSVSGLPVPRFVSLKSDKVNVRGGPNQDQDVRWVYTRAGMPVEVTAEFENWRRIRDWEGRRGLGLPLAVVRQAHRGGGAEPEGRARAALRERRYQSPVVAKLQAGVQGALQSCTGAWCEFRGKGFDGWIRQERLWGAYPNEKIE